MIHLALGLLLAAQAPADDGFGQWPGQPILVSQVQTPDVEAGRESGASTPTSAQPRIYQPPRNGQPRGSMGSLERGVESQPVARPLSLVPRHVAQTLSPRPHLYWSIDRPHAGKVVLTLSSRDAVEPECELELPSPTRAGVQAVDLAACPKDLETGTEYEWFVSLVVDPQKLSRNKYAQGWIERVALPEGFDAAHASAADFARRGLWYDALHTAATQRDRGAWQSLMAELSITTIDLP